MQLRTPVQRGAAGSVAALAGFTVATLVALTAPESSAAPIQINNHSFEESGPGNWSNDLYDPNLGFDEPQWLGRDGNNSGNAFIEFIGGFVSNGLKHIGIENNGYYVFQNTNIPYEANKIYTLTVGVGNRDDGFTPTPSLSIIGFTVLNEPYSDLNLLDGLDTDDQILPEVDPLLAANHDVFDASTIPNASFADRVVTLVTDDNPPEGNIVIFLGDKVFSPDPEGADDTGRSHFDNVRLEVFSALDNDGDGLPSDWEVENGLDPESADGDDGADGDPDGDDSPNIEEFTRETDPQDADSDDDNAPDGHETLNGGAYNGPGAQATDPLDPDTDGDTLLDGDEPQANPFVTDPTSRDTDADQFEDQAELTAGADPTDDASVPELSGDLIVGINFTGGRLGSVPASPVTGTAGVIPQANWNNLNVGVGSGAAAVDSTGADSLIRVDWTTDNTGTVSLDVPADDNASLMQGHLRTRNGVPTQVTIWNVAYESFDVYIYADADSTDGDGGDGDSTYTVNGQTIANVLDLESWPVFDGGGTFVEASEGASGNYLVFEGVTGPTVTITAVNEGPNYRAPINAIQLVRGETDTDEDGMPDIWENSNGLNPNDAGDAATSLDSDQLSNLEEYQAGTNPNNPDTDGDGLQDHVEDGGGVFVSADMTGTNPKRADTDGDGYLDGQENGSGAFNGAADPGSDPNKADTDGDLYPDFREGQAGSDPNDPNSKPPFPQPEGYWPFDDQGAVTTGDLSGNSNEGTLNGEPVYVAGHSGNEGDFALEFDGVDDYVGTTIFPDDFDTFAIWENYTLVIWMKFDATPPDRAGLVGANDTIEFGFNGGGNTEAWHAETGTITAPFTGALGQWHHVALTADATTVRLYVDGVQVATDDGVVPTAAAVSPINIGGGGIWDDIGTNGNWFTGQLDDVAVYQATLEAPEITALATRVLNPLGQPTGGGGGGDDGFRITDITRNPTTEEVTITFPSEVGVEYFLYRSDDELATWTEEADLTATDTTSVFTTNSGGSPNRNWRVQQ